MSAGESNSSAEHLYQVFSRYTFAGRKFCDFCYSSDEWQQISSSAVARLDVEYSRKLLWETADHWESADVYRHYLPRLLESLGPPCSIEDLYPLHVFETLIAMGFHQWPRDERDAVIEYLERLGRDHTDRNEWLAGIAALKDPAVAVPPTS